MYPNRVSCLSALSSCSSIESLIHGKEIHTFLLKSGLDFDEFSVSQLIEMYMGCGDTRSAELIFKSDLDRELTRGNIVIWNVMIAGYISNESFQSAFKLLIELLELGISPDSSTLVFALVLCSQLADLTFGMQIHKLVLALGIGNDVRVKTAVMEMYFKFGDPETGFNIFGRSVNHNLVMWGAVLSNCTQNGYPARKLELFRRFMLEKGSPDSVILLAVLQACSFLSLLTRGKEIHGLEVKMKLKSDTFVGSALVDMYAKCEDMKSTKKVFSRLSSWDLISWNAVISGFLHYSSRDEALKAFHDMQSEQIRPNNITASCVISVCAQMSAMKLCKELHCYLFRQGLETNVLVSNSLIGAYAKCGDIISSLRIFEKSPERNALSWNSIILGFGIHGLTEDMFVSFENMKDAGVKPDSVTFTALLSACSHTGKVDMGLEII